MGKSVTAMLTVLAVLILENCCISTRQPVKLLYVGVCGWVVSFLGEMDGKMNRLTNGWMGG
jgi:hypothetical protein